MPHYIGRLRVQNGTKHEDSDPCEAESPRHALKILCSSLPGYMKIMYACGFIKMQVIEVPADYESDDEDEEDEPEEKPQPIPDEGEEENPESFPA